MLPLVALPKRPRDESPSDLFEAMREAVGLTLHRAAERLGGDAVGVRELVQKTDGWRKQSDGREAFGYVHPKRMQRAAMRSILDAYRSVRPHGSDMKPGTKRPRLEKGEEADSINANLATLAELFAPMVDALRASGVVLEDHNFTIRWRFLAARHLYASVFHMDDGFAYGDEDGSLVARAPGPKCVATSWCIERYGESIFECGTRLLRGVPVLRDDAIQGIVDVVDPNKKSSRDRLMDEVINAARDVLGEFLQGHSPEEGGMRVEQIENGLITNLSEYVFHAAPSFTPDAFDRCFFDVCSSPIDGRGEPVTFVTHATLSDGSHVMFAPF